MEIVRWAWLQPGDCNHATSIISYIDTVIVSLLFQMWEERPYSKQKALVNRG